MDMDNIKRLPSSFRDPSGFLFQQDGVLLRQVHRSYQSNLDCLMNSGLYTCLTQKGQLVTHEEQIDIAARMHDSQVYKILRPSLIPFLSYPYEWSFSQLKDAALLTLDIQRTAIEHGMILKDATAYNVQFQRGAPIWIDTLSFEKYVEGRPWVAYRQFCQHFLAPLALMSHRDTRLGQLSRIHLDGIPIDLASTLLPIRSYLSLGLFTHIHLHAGFQRMHTHTQRKSGKLKHFRQIGQTDQIEQKPTARMSRQSMLGLLAHLRSTVEKLDWNSASTEWGDYYSDTNYSDQSFLRKKELVSEYLDSIKPQSVWDLGANAGEFSKISAEKGILTIAIDGDTAAAERHYRSARGQKNVRVLPLLIDLINPSASIGWMNRERSSLIDRGPADVAFALALIHHLAISNNAPFQEAAEFFASICRYLVIEFVPKEDSQVQRLLRAREDIFVDYDEARFESEFSKIFEIQRRDRIEGTLRTLYLMKKRGT